MLAILGVALACYLAWTGIMTIAEAPTVVITDDGIVGLNKTVYRTTVLVVTIIIVSIVLLLVLAL